MANPWVGHICEQTSFSTIPIYRYDYCGFIKILIIIYFLIIMFMTFFDARVLVDDAESQPTYHTINRFVKFPK
jgi:hypothetical protein